MQLEDGLHFPANQNLPLFFIWHNAIREIWFSLSISFTSMAFISVGRALCLAARKLTCDELLWLISHKKSNQNRFWSGNGMCACVCARVCMCCSWWRIIDGFPLNAFIYREDKLWRWKWHIERVAHVYWPFELSLVLSLSPPLPISPSFSRSLTLIHFWLWRGFHISRTSDDVVAVANGKQYNPNQKKKRTAKNNNKIKEKKKTTQHTETMHWTMDCIENKWFYRISFGEKQQWMRLPGWQCILGDRHCFCWCCT